MRALGIFLVMVFALPNFAGDFETLKWNALGEKRRGSTQQIVAGREFRDLVRKFVNNNQRRNLESYIRQMRKIVDIKASLNKFDDDELPILHDALLGRHVHYETIEMLLMNGADPNVGIKCNFQKSKRGGYLLYKGYTAAHVAVRMRRATPILELLKEYDTDFLRKDSASFDSWTAVRLAEYSNHQRALEFFEKYSDLRKHNETLSDDDGDGTYSDDVDEEMSDQQDTRSPTPLSEDDDAIGTNFLQEQTNPHDQAIVGSDMRTSITENSDTDLALQINDQKEVSHQTHVKSDGYDKVAAFLEHTRQSERDAEHEITMCGLTGSVAILGIAYLFYYFGSVCGDVTNIYFNNTSSW